MSIIFLERHDNEKRKNGWRAAGARLGGMPKRPVPADFASVAAKYSFQMIRLVEHYHSTEKVIRRWAKETDVKLLTYRESVMMSKQVKREFDPALDNDLLRMAVRAMTGKATT